MRTRKRRPARVGAGLPSQAYPGSSSPSASATAAAGHGDGRKKRRRREASVLRESRLADEEGLGGGDLVPPSDEDEYEAWLVGRERERPQREEPGTPKSENLTRDGSESEDVELGMIMDLESDLDLAASPSPRNPWLDLVPHISPSPKKLPASQTLRKSVLADSSSVRRHRSFSRTPLLSKPSGSDVSPAQSSGATTPTRRLSSSLFDNLRDGSSSSLTAGAASPLHGSNGNTPGPRNPSIDPDQLTPKTPHMAAMIPEASHPDDITPDGDRAMDLGMPKNPEDDFESGFEQSYNLPENDLRPPSQLLGTLTPSSPMIHPLLRTPKRRGVSQVTPSKSTHSQRAVAGMLLGSPESISEMNAVDEVGEPPPPITPMVQSQSRSQVDLSMTGSTRLPLPSRQPSSSPLAPAVQPDSPQVPPADEPPQRLVIPVDPALEQFRTVRTFRTRTTLQLQPYTRERQIYEAVLRRGGLRKGRNAIAPPKEISKSSEDEDEEAPQSSSSSASDVAQQAESAERIVIGNTPPLKQKRRREPIPLTDADYDEYFLEHGAVADDDDPATEKRLQKIARARLKAEKEEKRRQRQAEKARREFERLIRSDVQRESSSDDELAIPARPAKQTVTRTPARGPGGVIKYGRRTQKNARPHSTHFPSDSGSDVPYELPPPLPEPPLSQRSSDSPDMITSIRTPSQPVIDIEESLLPGDGSFYINDLPPATAKRRRMPSSSSASGSDTPDPETAKDRRARIAARMMPAVMLKRLENEAAAKERQRIDQQTRKRQAKSISPARPGRAVVRKGHGDVDMSGLLDMFASQGSSSSPSSSRHLAQGRPVSSREQPIVISDDEGGSDAAESDMSGSQAEEDNGPGRALARLFEGDFESLVAGAPSVRHKRQSKPHRRPNALDRLRKEKRPALAIRKQVSRPRYPDKRAMVQSRLDFPAQEKSPYRSTTKVKKSVKRADGKAVRPAIRLNDETIWATADFAFDDALPTPVQPTRRRAFARTTSKASSVGETVDAGVGKARSWAFFDTIPVDFGITPLPSGLYCDPDSVVGSGFLAKFVNQLKGGRLTSELEPCNVYGIELTSTLPQALLVSLIPIVFERTYNALVTFVNEDHVSKPDLKGLDFMLSRHWAHPEENEVRIELREAILVTNNKLDDLLASRKYPKLARHAVLDLRWKLLELVTAISQHGSDYSLVKTIAISTMSQLLSGGFDKTVRPLKRLLRGQAESPQIDDPGLMTWIGLLHILATQQDSEYDLFTQSLLQAFTSTFSLDPSGPIAAERMWFLIFGLCALSQFDVYGRTGAFQPLPRWTLVRKAASLIKIAHNEEAEERANVDQLRGRDRYIQVMLARCVRLSAVWKWHFDRASFSIATRDLGAIFKDRQYRNLPSEPPIDYPKWITSFDVTLTSAPDTKRDTAFELYLRLICVAASDIISQAQSLSEAQQAEKDVQRLIMSIIPVSPVKFNRVLPPTPKQLGQLVNRYSTMVAACFFSPSLLGWLLANSKKWAPFEQADFESRQISIRGLMYVGVACRHHHASLLSVVIRLADTLSVLRRELDDIGKPSAPAQAPSKIEIERTMVLVVSCIRQLTLHHAFDADKQIVPEYPDPVLLHESWTTHVFGLDLDYRCQNEVVSAIQTFLNVRMAALPKKAKSAREEKLESWDEYGSLGFEMDMTTIANLGGEVPAKEDPVDKMDEQFVQIIEDVICPRIFKLLSDMSPAVPEEVAVTSTDDEERQKFLVKLSKCYSDCAAVLVIEHRKLDWSAFVGQYGRMSWSRLSDPSTRLQVGLNFMLNVATLDPGCFASLKDDFLELIFATITTYKLSVEHKLLSAVLCMPHATSDPLLDDLPPVATNGLDRVGFIKYRGEIIDALLRNVGTSMARPTSNKAFLWKLLNLLVSGLAANDKSIVAARVLHKEEYRAFAASVISSLERHLGSIVTPHSIPALKHFLQ